MGKGAGIIKLVVDISVIKIKIFLMNVRRKNEDRFSHLERLEKSGNGKNILWIVLGLLLILFLAFVFFTR